MHLVIYPDRKVFGEKGIMQDQVRELTLLLLYLTSWEEDDGFGGTNRRNWKKYNNGILKWLTEQHYLYNGKYVNKTVYLTKEGIMEAEKLMKKYQIDR